MTAFKKGPGKLMWHLMPWEALEQVCRVVMFGAAKYSPGNWQEHQDGTRIYLDAAMRHMVAWHKGETMDESGFPTLAHAGASILMALWHDMRQCSTPIGVGVDEEIERAFNRAVKAQQL